MPVTRGFLRGRPEAERKRLPPGQYDTGSDWPVLTAEATPRHRPEQWTITVDGLVEQPHDLVWRETHALPASTYFGDIHCVTTWSKFDTTFAGVSVDTLLEIAGPTARGDVRDGALDDRLHHQPAARATSPAARPGWSGSTTAGRCRAEHGGPVRLLVPHLYFWKSAKWVSRLELLARDRPGFWEQNGYHDRGDPWLEQRYQGDP